MGQPQVSILCQSRLFLLRGAINGCCCGILFVSILCQSRLFLLQDGRSNYRCLYREYPSSVNRGYFSCKKQSASSSPQLSVSILCQSRLFLLLFARGVLPTGLVSIHPLSIEAISPAYTTTVLQPGPTVYPSSVNRGYFSCNAGQPTGRMY